MSNNVDNTNKISPKEFTLNAFKGNGKRLAEVLKHYWKSVNYYKKDNPLIKQAEDLFQNKAVDVNGPTL